MGVTTCRRGIVRVIDGAAATTTDAVAVEAPLTIALDADGRIRHDAPPQTHKPHHPTGLS